MRVENTEKLTRNSRGNTLGDSLKQVSANEGGNIIRLEGHLAGCGEGTFKIKQEIHRLSELN